MSFLDQTRAMLPNLIVRQGPATLWSGIADLVKPEWDFKRRSLDTMARDGP